MDMAVEQRFEFNISESYEKRFCSPVCHEYLVKYEYRPPFCGHFTIEKKIDVIVFVKLKLYKKFENKSILTINNVFQGQKITFGIYYNGYSSYSTLLRECSIKMIPYEKYQTTPIVNKSTCIEKPAKSSFKAAVTEKNLDELSSDMGRLLKQSDLSDIILTDGSSEIPAHKVVLFARSPVFAKMFQHPMKENLENRVAITDISFEVLIEMLSYMYSGIVTLKNVTIARDLYVAADKYDIKGLKSICLLHLKDVDLDNVLDTLALADMYKDKVLKQSALEYIARNYSQVKVQETWNTFISEHKVLAIEVLSFLLDKKL